MGRRLKNWSKRIEKFFVEVTRTDPLEKLVWVNKNDSDRERNKILKRIEDLHPA